MNRKELLVISVCVFLTIIAWMIADLIHAKQTTVVADVITEVHIPTYTIDPNTLEVLKQKQL